MLWSCTTALGRKFGTDKIITVPTFDDKIFYNQNRPSRSGACFYSNKYDRLLGYKLLPITEGMTRIQGTVENVAEIYHSHETCYVYEDTEVIFNASLCGLKVILIRTPYFSDLGNQITSFIRIPASNGMMAKRSTKAWGRSRNALPVCTRNSPFIWLNSLNKRKIEVVSQFEIDNAS